MITLRPAAERGHFDHGWLDTSHTFSFADYYDPSHMGFRALRVINEDRVQPGRGFGTHPHRDMEIISWVLDGALTHQDSMGNGSVIRPGEAQRMTAGTGVLHSEANASPKELVHFLQIWLVPSARGLPPGYEQQRFSTESLSGGLRLVASPDGRDGSITIHTDASLYAGRLAAKQTAQHPLAAGRHAWVHVARGTALVNGHRLGPGDGAAFSDEALVQVEGVDAAEVLVFDLG